MCNLIVAYHERNRRRDILEVIGKILQFSPEDREKVGLGSGGVGRIISNMIAPLPPPPIDEQEVFRGSARQCPHVSLFQETNLLELWVHFLEAETPSA